MKTDVLIYNLLADHPEIFFQLAGRAPAEAEGYHLESLEMKQTSYRLDGIFRPDARDPDRPIHFVEVMFWEQDDFYERFFAKIFDYFDQRHESRPWYAWALFATRSLDPGVPMHCRHGIADGVLNRCYLEDLRKVEELPIGLHLLRLVVTPESEVVEEGRRVLQRAREETDDGPQRQEMVKSVETILVYKFADLKREEIERMFSVDAIRHTAVYREAFEEGETEGKKEGEAKGKLDAVPLLLELGAAEERIARDLGLELTAVREVAALVRGGSPAPRRPRSRKAQS